MLFSVGTRVKFLHSSDSGVITALLEDGMVSVLLDHDDMEIPAFVEDLVRSDSEWENPHAVKAKFVPGKPAKTILPPSPSPVENQYAILKSIGIQLAFDPILKADAIVEKYGIFLINDTKFDVLFQYELSFQGYIARKESGKLQAYSVFPLGELLVDQLNDSPSFDIQCWRITTEGTGSRLAKNLKIKPKQFFKKKITAPLLNRPAHLFRLFEDLLASDLNKERKEDLRTYTQRHARPVSTRSDTDDLSANEIMEFAGFIPEVDLHIEKLSDNPAKLSKAEIVHIQIRHFEQYIREAIRLGVERVFIIHGVGEGRLRDAIATRLIQMPEVKTFRNEYHPRYGWGATEVVFV